MTANEVKTVVKKHRLAALIGGAMGLLLLVGYVGYDIAMTPARPDVHSSEPAEVMAFIRNDRGLASLSDIEQKQFLSAWRDHIARDPANLTALKNAFAALKETDRKQFTEALLQHFKRAFMEDAQRFDQLPMEERFPFLRTRVKEFDKYTPFLRDVAMGFGQDFGGAEGLKTWILEHTTPEERDLGMAYGKALEKVRQQIQKEQVIADTQPAPEAE